MVVHVAHEGAKVRMLADEGGRLCRVDEGSSELASLIDPELEGYACQ